MEEIKDLDIIFNSYQKEDIEMLVQYICFLFYYCVFVRYTVMLVFLNNFIVPYYNHYTILKYLI